MVPPLDVNACLVRLYHAHLRIQEMLQQVLDTVPSPPDRNCSCHINPPCHDCVEHSGWRETFSDINNYLNPQNQERMDIMASILFTKNLPNAQTPTKGTPHAAAYDLYAANILVDEANNQLIVDTGLSTSFAHGYVLLVFGRSGLAMQHGIRLSNGVGVIDADYRGPLKVMLRSDQLDLEIFARTLRPGDRVAQAMLVPIPFVDWVQVGKLDDTQRGNGGFGSTGS